MFALTGMNIFFPPRTMIVRPESITCSLWLISFKVISAIQSVARIVFDATILTSSSISLFGITLKTVKFLEEFFIENLISCVLQIEIYLKLHSFGLQITQQSGTTEIHFISIFLPFLTFNLRFSSIFPPPSEIPKKLCEMQMFSLPFGSSFPFEGETLKSDYF